MYITFTNDTDTYVCTEYKYGADGMRTGVVFLQHRGEGMMFILNSDSSISFVRFQ